MARNRTTNGDGNGSNGPEPVTDEVRREFWLKALSAKRDLETAQAEAKSKNGTYHALLKEAKKRGLDPDAIVEWLARRHDDPAVVAMKEAERARMGLIAGILNGVQTELAMPIDPGTAKEQAAIEAARAYDDGNFSGAEGSPRERNPFAPGSERYDDWDRGWLAGQKSIADGMKSAEASQPSRRGRPPGSKSKNSAPHQGAVAPLAPNTPAQVAAAIEEDDAPKSGFEWPVEAEAAQPH